MTRRDILSGYLDAWRKENVELDGVYSGFLGSPDQVSIIQRLYREYPSALRLVDPVMATPGRCTRRTRRNCARRWGSGGRRGRTDAEPDRSEHPDQARLPRQDLDDAAVTELLDALLGLGAKNVVLKGIDHGDGKIINYVASAEKALPRRSSLCTTSCRT